jgi:hypothetical protein
VSFGDIVRNLTTIGRPLPKEPPSGPAADMLAVGSRTQSAEPQLQGSVFTSAQALTYPVAVVLIGGAWAALQRLSAPWTESQWVPLIASLALGGIITFPSISQEVANQYSRHDRIFVCVRGILVGALNSLVLFGAVAGAKDTVSASPGAASGAQVIVSQPALAGGRAAELNVLGGRLAQTAAQDTRIGSKNEVAQ